MNRGYHVVLFFSDQITRFELEVFLVLSLGFLNVVAQGLLLYACPNVFLVFFRELIVADRWLLRFLTIFPFRICYEFLIVLNVA